MGCLVVVLKYVLFILNLIFTIIGLAVVGVGVFMLVVLSDALDAIPVFRTVSIVIIVIGGVIFLLAFFGCCGAVTENKCLLIMFAVFMAIFAAAQIYIVVVMKREFGDVGTTVSEWIDDFFLRPDSREMFYAVEFVFSCCGTSGHESYDGILTFLPPTCCPGFDLGSVDLGQWQNITDIADIGGIGAPLCLAEHAFDGCTENLTDWLDVFVKWFFNGLVIIIAVEILSILMAVILTCSISSKTKAKRAYY